MQWCLKMQPAVTKAAMVGVSNVLVAVASAALWRAACCSCGPSRSAWWKGVGCTIGMLSEGNLGKCGEMVSGVSAMQPGGSTISASSWLGMVRMRWFLQLMVIVVGLGCGGGTFLVRVG